MIVWLVLFAVNTLYIFLKAFQQLNVVHDKYLWIPIVSLCMALCEVISIGAIAAYRDLWLAVPIGLGGGVGCLIAMWMHKKMRNRKGEH